MSLVVLNKLLIECKRDIALFARPAMRIISTSLDVHEYQTNKMDVEVLARASNCFLSYTKGTDGGGVGIDDALTEGYLGVLKKFAKLSTFRVQSEKPDDEEQSRIRLIGLQGLGGASASESVLGSSGEFTSQVKIIIPALMSLLHEASIPDLENLNSRRTATTHRVSISGGEPRLDRVQSLSAHVPGEKGPSTDDVSVAAFKSLYDLVSQCHTSQASQLLDVVFEFLDTKGWQDVERYTWLAKALAGAMLLQSRFVVPTRLIETLVNMPDDVPPSAKHFTILAMVTSVLSSHISLVGLAVTDILSSLINVIERRVSVDQRDALLPDLVTCVSSLGTHIYYADQINDIVEETALQMVSIPTSNPARQEILRVLIHCIRGVMTAADVGDEQEAAAREAVRSNSPASELERPNKGKGPAPESPAVEIPRRDLGRRNPIAPEVWQETLPLLCESTYPVRAAYASLLLFYLQTELPRDKHPRPDEPNIQRFCNALQAAVYTLAISSRLGVGEPIPSGPPSPTPRSSRAEPTTGGTDSPPRPGVVTFTVSEPTPIATPQESMNRRGTMNGMTTPRSIASGNATPPRKPMRGGRRVSLPLNRLQTVTDLSSFDNVATPYDYTAILQILQALHSAVPSASLLSGSPMLLALDRDASTLIHTPGDQAWVSERRTACRETCALAWRSIAYKWDNAAGVEIAERALNSLPRPLVIPDPRGVVNTPIPPPDEPVAFLRDETEGAMSSTAALIPPSITDTFAASVNVQGGTRMDQGTLAARLAAPWTVEGAIRDSVERFSSPPAEHARSTALMAIPNSSYQSFTRPVSRSVDVTDLRDALAGSTNGNASAAQSVASTTGSLASPPGRATKPDTKEILKEIFKDKKKRAV